jgi:ribosomal protein S12 methylthiotransferase accessory factor
VSSRALDLRSTPFLELVQAHGGVVGAVRPLQGTELRVPAFRLYWSGLGNLTQTFPSLHTYRGQQLHRVGLGGGGGDEQGTLALIRSVAEALERYATVVVNEHEVIVASQRELGERAIELASLPVCSPRELASPKCNVRPPDPDAPIRWVPGYSLLNRCERYVPLALTHIYINEWPAERFSVPITTGVAAGPDLASALVSAICEVIERDALSLTWLGQLPLARIVFDRPIDEPHAEKFRRLGRSSVQHLFFDATTDLGIPTVYALQLLDGSPRLAQFVGASTDFDALAACAKTIREAACGRTAGHQDELPADPADFRALTDGATFMGYPEQRRHFAFLLDSPARRSLSELAIESPSTPEAKLRFLVERLRALNMEAIAIELTTDELRERGLRVVRVVIPALMPLVFVHSARFLGHPRLYDYVRRAGRPNFSERDVHSAPQPFA